MLRFRLRRLARALGVGARRSASGLAAAAVAAALAASGCAGHEDKTRTALEALDRGAPEAAVEALTEAMEADGPNALPRDLEGDNALLVLDRGTVKLGLNRYPESAKDFGAADKAIEVLDLTSGTAGEVGKYLYSDSVGPYKAPAYEKLLINTLNLMNYLAVSDLTGAKVEARRLAVMQKYLRDRQDETALLGLGSYLAGFAFEKAGANDEAIAYYDDALRYAQYASLRDPLRVLTRGGRTTPGIRALVGEAGPLPSVGETGEAEVVVVVGFGRTPQKIPMRIPIGLALTLVSADISPRDRAQANELAAKGLVTWVNFPVLAKGKGQYALPTFTLDGRPQALEQALDVEHEVRAAWEAKQGTVILAAITRTIARVVAGEVAQGATEALAKDAGPLGLVVGLATSATLTALDTPDTRAWSTLPARVAVARQRVPAGRHRVVLAARGVTRTFEVNLAPGGYAFVPLLALR